MSANRGRGRAASAAYHQQVAEPPVRGSGRGGYGRGMDVQQRQQEATPSPSLRGARGGRGVGGHRDEHQPPATSLATPLSAVNPSVVDPLPVARGHRPPMSRYGAYVAFTKQREELEQKPVGPTEKDEPKHPLLDKVVLRMQEHKKAEEESTNSQIQEVVVTSSQHDGGHEQQGGAVVVAVSRESNCRECLFRAEFVHLMRSIGHLLTEFGNAIGGGRNIEQNHHGNAIADGHNNEQNGR
uniref:Uncharacterized protein n=1 Tax=Globodera rostochiensis TaxID=31243 RepID=A0A914HSP1_GLORO